MPAMPLVRRIVWTMKWLVLAGFAGCVLLIAGLLIEDSRKVSLPEPSGPFAVGRAIEDWVDHAHMDDLAPVPGTKRELLVWIWYPTANTTAPLDEYQPPALRPKPESSDARNPWTYLTRDPSLVQSHSRRNVDVAPGGPFPIVLFRAGASAGVLNYSSFGGAAVAEFCRRDPRCRAGVDIDGAPQGVAIREGMKQPFMLLLSDHSAEAGPETDRILADVRSLYDHLSADSRLWVDMPGSFHFMFSDDGAVMKSAVVRGALRLLGRLRIDARRQLAATSYCLRTFFEAHLNGPAGTRPAIPSSLAPEVRLVR